MTDQDQKQLGNILWGIADQLRGAMNADDFRDYMLSFLFLRYLSDNYETAAQTELGPDYRCVTHGLLFHSSLLASTRLPKGTAWFSPLKFPTGGELYADEATACSPRSHALSASVTFRPTGGRFLRTAKILK